MVGQRLKSYVQSCGLEAEDVPKVLATFVTAKYSTWAAAAVLGVRYQPLRRLFLARNTVLPSTFRFSSFHQRRWLQQTLDRGKELQRKPSSRTGDRQIHSIAYDGRSRKTMAMSDALRTARSAGARAARAARSRYDTARARCSDAKKRWHSAGRELLRLQLQQRHDLLLLQRQSFNRFQREGSWYAWVSAHYWKLSDKLISSASSSVVWRTLSSKLRSNPRGLALGLAEGTILYKFTFFLHAPLQLWIIVQLFRQRRDMLRCEGDNSESDSDSQTSEVPQIDGAVAEARRTAQHVIAATRDANELASEVMADYRESFGILP